MRRTGLILFALVLLYSHAAWSVSSLSLVDSTDRFLGTLPLIPRGDEQLIPLNTLAHRSDWILEQTKRAYIVTTPSGIITFVSGNPFVQIESGCLQLRMAPQEWDGALWFPLSNLTDLFSGDAEFDLRKNMIRIRMAYADTPADEPPILMADTDTVPWTLSTIIVDPGHGGKDPGATGLYNLKEKQVTLDVAMRLARLLENRGLKARLTRVDDRFVSLRERSRFANDERGDLFVSIHCNSAKDSLISGVETYFLKPARTERAVQAAMRENSVVELENGNAEYPELTEENFILLTMATSQYIKDSETWAATLMNEAAKTSGIPARGVDQAGFYVLMGASMPAVLLECGYLSNPEDAKLLSTEQGRQKIAEAMANSIMSMKTSLEVSASR
ncbi:MAG: N-acetylmuramoyl-L-alanine amidase family protein [Calditrichota bacterium]